MGSDADVRNAVTAVARERIRPRRQTFFSNPSIDTGCRD